MLKTGSRPSTMRKSRSHRPRIRAWHGLLALALLPGCDRSPEAPAGVEAAPSRANSLVDAINDARPGDTIVLPAGTFAAGIRLPPRVSLRGAGYRKTILDARKVEVGVSIEAGAGAEIADLTVIGASKTAVLVAGASDVALRRLRTTGGLNGVNFAGVTGGRIENVISDDNRYGIVVSGGHGNAVVNCTLARNSSLALSFPSGDATVAFNNCIAESETGVYIGESAQGVRLDHNLYFATFVGKRAGQIGRKTLGEWQSLSGQDSRSVQLPLAFRDPKNGDYRPSGTLPWSLERAVTSDWGVAELGAVKAPALDAEGAPRAGAYDLGAFEVAPSTPPRPPDGLLTIRSDPGIKSAGVFAPGGREVSYLFHNLPLPAGKHPFWLPTRDSRGSPIPPGTYELRTVESALSWESLGRIGNSGDVFPPGKAAGTRPSFAVFDRGGRLVVGYGRSPDATILRGYDAASGRWLWAFGGSSGLHGLSMNGDGSVDMLRPAGTQGSIARIDPATGTLVRRGDRDSDSGALAFEGGGAATGLAELDGHFYVADAGAGVIRHGPKQPFALDRTFAVAQPSSPSADASTGRLWLIGRGSRLLALDPAGKVVADVAPLEAPAALAARDGRLAVASRATGKVHLFDASDPGAPRPIATVGTGDGPYGPYRPDRFHFQRAAEEPGCDVSLAMGPNGELAVTEDDRVLVFDREGKSLWTTFGLAGDACVVSHADRGRVFTPDGRKSLRLDEGAGTWAPDAFWEVPRGTFLGDFVDGGKTFGAFVVATVPPQEHGALLLVRYDGQSARPMLLMAQEAKTGRYLSRKDDNRDGRLDDRDEVTVMSPPRGAPDPLRGGPVAHRVFSTLEPGGDLVTPSLHAETWGAIWHYSGLDLQGTPTYRLQDCRELRRRAGGLISPYTRKPDPSGSLVGTVPEADGGFTGLIHLRSSPGGTGLIDHAGTDLIRVDGEGLPLWDHPLSAHKGLVGLQAVGPLLLTGVGATCEVLAFNRDGLGVGSFGPGPEVHYSGSSLDQPRSLRAYRGIDGRTYALVADNANGMPHWWRLHGDDTIATGATPITLDQPAAQALAALPAAPVVAGARPATPSIRVPHLAADLPIDGELEKWRKAGIAPQIIVTPETAAGAIDGPRDVSALIRLARRGNALYLQVLTFDDVPSFPQPVARRHRQDGVEFRINGSGSLPGSRFDITRTVDAGPVVLREHFDSNAPDFLVPPAHAPRVVKVLPNARDLPERRLIESIYGVDMADSPVIVTECKLPIDTTTYKDAVNDLFPLKSGRKFRIGFAINDSDDPGTDVPDYLVWPATYTNFNTLDDLAIAVLE